MASFKFTSLALFSAFVFGCAEAPENNAAPDDYADVLAPEVSAYPETTGGNVGASVTDDEPEDETGGTSSGTGGNPSTDEPSSTGGTDSTGGTTTTTGGTVYTCDSTTAEECECEDGTVGVRWMRGDCTAYTACVNCKPVEEDPIVGSGGSGTAGSGNEAGAEIVDPGTGGTASETGGTSSGTGGNPSTGGTSTGPTVVLRFYALDGVTWANFLLAVPGLMQSDYSCTGTATFRECMIPNLDIASPRRFYARTGPEGAYEWIPRDNWETGRADSNHAAVTVFRLNGEDLLQMDFRYIRNAQDNGYEFEIFSDGVRPGESDDDRDGTTSPDDCDDGNPSLQTNCGITGGGGPDLIGTGGTGNEPEPSTGGTGGITGGGGGDLATGGTGTGGTVASTIRTIRVDLLNRDFGVALPADSAHIEVISPAYQYRECWREDVPDPALNNQLVQGWRCLIAGLDLSREIEIQGYVGSTATLYLAKYICDPSGCGDVNLRYASYDFRAYAYVPEGNAEVPLAALDQGEYGADWSRNMALRFNANRDTVHAFIPAWFW